MTDDPAAPVARSGGGRLALPLALGAGLALRVVAASQFRVAGEWEADSFLWAWSEPSTRALASGCRAAGLQVVWELWGSVAPAQSVLMQRVLAVAVSLLLLVCAWALTRTLLRERGSSPRVVQRAGFRLCLWWAVLPALVWTGPRVVAEQVSGGMLCLLAAAFVRHRMAASVWSWVALCLTCALSLAVGGIVVAVALAVGLLVFLVALPRASVALPVLGASMLAAAAAVGFARWHDDGRPWRPDTGPAYALSALLEAPLVLDDRERALPELRGDAVWRASRDAVRDRPAVATWADFARRAQALIAPWRFGAGPAVGRGSGTDTRAGAGSVVLGILDALLAGGALLMAVVVLARKAPPGACRLPRFAAGAAAVTLVLATIAGATGPFALSGVVLIALALAASDEPDEGAPHRPSRRIRFLAGGLALAALALVPASGERPASLWLEQLTQQHGQGRQLVALLSAGGPVNGPEELQLAQILMDPGAPFLRRPLLAREHAMAALAQLPSDDDAVAVLVRAEVECLHYSEAEDLAQSMLDDAGSLSPRGRMLADWVRDKAHRARLDGLR